MVRKRGNSWQALVKVRDAATGEYRQLTATRPTKTEAERWLTTTLARHGDAGSLAFGATVGHLLDAWYEIASPDWSPTTRRNNRSIIERHLRPKWGDVSLRKLRPVDLDTWYSSKRKDITASTIRRIHGVLHLALEQAVRWDWIPDNPAAKSRPPKMTRAEIRPPAVEELLTLLDAAHAHDPDIGTAVHLAAATGARRGELVALRWSDVDLVLGTLRIANAVVLGERDEAIVKSTKTGNVRTISLDAGTLQVLSDHRVRCEKRAKTCKAKIRPDGFIFSLDVDGTNPWRPDYLSSHYERVRKSVGLENVRLHDLRHYHATRLLTAGVDLATVAGRLGHSGGGRTTLAVYAHFLEQADRAAADVIGDDLRR